MQLTMTGEYAIRAMIHLSASPEGVAARIPDVSREWDIPEPFLRKICAKLSSAGLIVTQRGANGGIRLARPAAEMTVLDVVEAVEGRILLNQCLLHDGFCPRDRWCCVHSLWAEAQKKLKEVLSGKNLADLARESVRRKHPSHQHAEGNALYANVQANV